MIKFNIDDSKLPELLKKGGTKAYLNALKTIQNRALGAARTEAARYLRKEYGLPTKGSKVGPPSPYAKPSIRAVLSSSLVRGAGGIESGVSSKLFSDPKRLSAIRFLNSELRPIKQKGIPRAKRTQLVEVKLGRKTYLKRKSFVQKGNSPRMHIFRSVETTRKWLMKRQTITSIHSMLERRRALKAMRDAASVAIQNGVEHQIKKLEL